ncbi:GMC family oxidoreductase [Paraburkholderia unamae]|uniref:Choline dehydrogenase n=1 Tax=Paraburkholderia unamae TaxID=219649 RepID=A0ABX5KMD5_9BURK|nr:GMC family oxidoreductase N-terminal domain-containing protein [Paraburkholderia unamae]PVX81162.1 choline dehydrogenase [Paraburkholderia unamae]
MNETFDYIVVGAGAAGGMLAARLSEQQGLRVLLLEAGGSHRRMMVEMPAGWGRLIYDKRYAWVYESEPERWAGGRRIKVPRGKLLGGSTSINGMLYVRGHRRDFDDWDAAGAQGWSWADLLPYFLRTEDQRRIRNALHGTGGPLTAADLDRVHPISHAMLAASREAGWPQSDDFNDGEPRGAGLYQVNVDAGRRSSIARNAIEPAMGRPGLKVVQHALVTRVQIDGQRASGVVYRLPDGTERFAAAAREVLLCGGAINTPQLLMLSGIGPAAPLAALGIRVHADLPGVGANLQDHAIVPMTWRLKPGTPSLNAAFRGLGVVVPALRYLLTRRGEMTTPPSEFGAWIQSDPTLPYHDLQIFGLPVTGDIETALREGRETPEAWPGFTLAPYQLRPWSRGSVWLKSADAREAPALQFNYLDDERDRRALLYGLRAMRELAAQPSLARLTETETRPGPDVRSDDEWLDWLGPFLTTGHHAVGTCRMGRADDPLTVVTPDLRVKGIAGLRVIDASVMPNLICGNTTAATVVIGDKGADLVLGRAGPGLALVEHGVPASVNGA